MAPSLTIDELGGRCHHYRQRAEQVFELAGHWSSIAEQSETRLAMARVSTHCSAHVEWWSQRVPSVDVEFTDQPQLTDAHQRVEVAIAALVQEGPTPLGVQGLCELMAQLCEDAERWEAEHDRDLDAPTGRVLDLVIADLRRDLGDLTVLLG